MDGPLLFRIYMTQVELLNQRFGEYLGFPDGVHPKFCWVWAPDMTYLFRPDRTKSFMLRSWGSRLGRKWVLAQWRPTELTRDQWESTFRGSRPYPGKWRYIVHAETALPEGMAPNDELTQGYARTLSNQMAVADFTAQCEEEARQYLQASEDAILEDARDFEPAFGNWDVFLGRDGYLDINANKGAHGSHGSHTEFQVPGLREAS